MKRRDMTSRQFSDALQRHGFSDIGFMGYVRIPIEGREIRVSVMNANSTRLRDILAYLLREKSRHESKSLAPTHEQE